MTTGASHYQQAERLIELSRGRGDRRNALPPSAEQRVTYLVEAQVHAALALAAAVIEPTVQTFARGEGTDERVITEWSEAVSG